MASAAPYTVNLDPDVAQQLADQGGALLVLNLPEGSYFGIDHMAFQCGPRFKGIKMLPPGPHFACYSVPGSQRHGGGHGLVTGFFFHVPSPAASSGGRGTSAPTDGVLVRRYNAAEELLVELPEEEAQRYALGVRRYEFDSGLAPYNLHAWRHWRELTYCLDARVIDTLRPVGDNICTAAEAALDEQEGPGGTGAEADQKTTAAEARLRRQLQEGRAARAASAAATAADAPSPSGGGDGLAAMQVEGPGPGPGPGGDSGPGAASASPGAVEGGGPQTGGAAATPSGLCFYSELRRLVKEAGLTPAQLTALNMDRTSQLEALAAERWGGHTAAVVGEMQFAFIAFVFAQSLRGFQQWRALVTLFLNCEAGPLTSQVDTFVAFTAALRAQLSLALADAGDHQAEGATAGAGAAALGLGTHGSLIEEVLLAGGGRDCFLRHHLATFFEVLREAGPQQLDPRLQQEAAQLRGVLSRLVGWQFDGLEVLGEDDDDEYAPVVVELPEGEMC